MAREHYRLAKTGSEGADGEQMTAGRGVQREIDGLIIAAGTHGRG